MGLYSTITDMECEVVFKNNESEGRVRDVIEAEWPETDLIIEGGMLWLTGELTSKFYNLEKVLKAFQENIKKGIVKLHFSGEDNSQWYGVATPDYAYIVDIEPFLDIEVVSGGEDVKKIAKKEIYDHLTNDYNFKIKELISL